MKQFDTPKKKKGAEDNDNDNDNDIDAADLQVALDEIEDELEDERIDKDSIGEFNIRIELTEEEVEALEETVKPVRRVLTKVSLLPNTCWLNTNRGSKAMQGSTCNQELDDHY